LALLIPILAFIGAAGLCAALMPLLRRGFLVKPVARSSHVAPTPQGGGLVVIPVTLLAAFGAAASAGAPIDWRLPLALVGLSALGGWDDLAPLSPALRLALQAVAAATALSAMPLPSGFSDSLPPLLVEFVLLVGGLWFINLTNFMDGLDLMTVAQFVPAFVTAYLLLSGQSGVAAFIGLLCLAGAGALAGFALLNWPPARLFLGDSGSLPIGLLGAAAILAVTRAAGPAAGLLPFLYPVADASLTLARRVIAQEPFWRAHRQHFYQRATKHGLMPPAVVARVGACNLALCLGALFIAGKGAAAQTIALGAGGALVALLLRDLVRERA